MKPRRGRPIAVRSSTTTPRPVPVIAAALIAWAIAASLVASAVISVATFEHRAGIGSVEARPEASYMLAVVTVLSISAILLALGALATWLRKTDMLLVFALWMIIAGALILGATEAGGPARLGLYLLAAAAAAAPIALLLLPDARAWLPAIPLHPVVLILLFGPLVGGMLIVVRHRENERFGVPPRAVATGSPG